MPANMRLGLCFAFSLVFALALAIISIWSGTNSYLNIQIPNYLVPTDVYMANGKAFDEASAVRPHVVHVIQTRFMQNQPQLIHLGRARIKLFETFCRPTVLAQTNQNFLWIIRADPDLHPILVEEMEKILAGQQNIIFMGSNNQNKIALSSRSGESFNDYMRPENNSTPNIPGVVWSGNLTLFKDAYEYAATGKGIVLETRLDADDGIHYDWIKYLQEEATLYLTHNINGRHKNIKELEQYWKIWCVHSHIQWHPENSTNSKVGYLLREFSNICVTPGKKKRDANYHLSFKICPMFFPNDIIHPTPRFNLRSRSICDRDTNWTPP